MRRALLVAFMSLVWFGCDRTGRRGLDPLYCEPMINGYLDRVEFYDGDVGYWREFSVFDPAGLRMVPEVRINQIQVPCYYYSWTNYRYGDENYFQVSKRYKLEVDHYWGTAFARVVMPGNFRLTYPPSDSYVLDLESTLVITWRRADGAQWYWVDAYCCYDFYDSLYRWDDHEFEFDTTVSDTFLILAPGRVFPSYVMDVIEGDGSALVWAGYGPPVEPGDYGNVRGNGFGFFNAFNEAKERYFWVGAPIVERRSPGVRESRVKLRSRIERRNQLARPR